MDGRETEELRTMGETLRRLKEEARALSRAEQLDLVEDLLANLEDLDSALSAEWAAEAKDRLEAYRSGELAAVAIEDVTGSPRRS
jgi:putative addiction module component (TIGR02574 family)